MINQYDLYDITFAFVSIRNDISNIYNEEIISKILIALDNTKYEENQIRKSISTIRGLDCNIWHVVYHNNVYVNHKILKNEYIYILLKKICEEMLETLKKNNYKKAKDLVDCFHCLPNIIADNNFTVPKRFWRTFVKPYRNKWNKEFLVAEERILRKHTCNWNLYKSNP